MAVFKEIPAGKFKAQCLGIMDEVGACGGEVIITKRGKPVAKLVAIDDTHCEPVYGCMAGTAEIVKKLSREKENKNAELTDEQKTGQCAEYECASAVYDWTRQRLVLAKYSQKKEGVL